MRAAWFVCAVATIAAGCSAKGVCDGKAGTCVTLTVTSSQAQKVDELDFTASGAATGTQSSTTSAKSLPIEIAITLPTTATGTLALDVAGKLAGAVVGTGSGSVAITAGQHAALSIDIEPTNVGPDMTVPLDGGTDMPNTMEDLEVVFAEARLIAPLSTSTVTKQTPTFHWALSGGMGTPVVDICTDRACAHPITTPTITVSAGKTSAVPNAALPTGWIYWRVRVVDGSQVTMSTSRVWQFWVNKTSGPAVDTSSGTVLDVNGDGFADFLVGARSVGSGAAHVYIGGGAGTFTRLDLSSPDTPAGFFGCSVASAGDVNGDGYADFVIGNYTGGTAHVFFGSATPSTADWNGAGAAKRIDLTAPGGISAWASFTSSAGDVNGDGYADFIVASQFPGSYTGTASVFFGGATPTAANWNAATTSTRIDLAPPIASGSAFGGAIAPAGDINGDGFGDFLIGAPFASSNVGAAYVYFGSATPTATAWNTGGSGAREDLTSPDTGSGQFGSVGTGGDINNDGFSDFVVGSPGASTSHIYLGSGSASASEWNGNSNQRLDLTNPDAASSGFGSTGSFVGDVNGDGFDDVFIGAPAAATSYGATHLFLGEATPNTTHWNGTTPTERVDIASPQVSGECGDAVGAIGDSNGDGYSDFIVGCPNGASGAGAAAAYFGVASPVNTTWTGTSTKRTDLASPDGASGLFGSSVGPSRAGT
jgi:hypothetical protein